MSAAVDAMGGGKGQGDPSATTVVPQPRGAGMGAGKGGPAGTTFGPQPRDAAMGAQKGSPGGGKPAVPLHESLATWFTTIKFIVI